MVGPSGMGISADIDAANLLQAALTIGLATSVAIPTAIDEAVSFTTDTGLAVDFGASLIVADTTDAVGGYFIFRVDTYDSGTGAVTGFCEAFTGSGAIADAVIMVFPYSSFTDPSILPILHAWLGGL